MKKQTKKLRSRGTNWEKIKTLQSLDLYNQQIQSNQAHPRSVEDIFPKIQLNQEATNKLK